MLEWQRIGSLSPGPEIVLSIYIGIKLSSFAHNCGCVLNGDNAMAAI